MLFQEGFFSAKDLATVSGEELMNIPGVGEKKAHNIKAAAGEYLQHLAEEQSRTPEAVRHSSTFTAKIDPIGVIMSLTFLEERHNEEREAQRKKESS